MIKEQDLSSLEGDPTFLPPPGKILVARVGDEKIGSLYIPQSAAERSTLGRIVAVYEPFTDPDTDAFVEPFYRVGDLVIFGPHAGINFTARIGNKTTKLTALVEKEILTKVVFSGADAPSSVSPLPEDFDATV